MLCSSNECEAVDCFFSFFLFFCSWDDLLKNVTFLKASKEED